MDFQELINKYPHKKEKLLKLEKRAKIVEMKVALKENAGIKLLIEEITEIVQGINVKLMTDRKLTDIERAELFKERDVYLWFLNIFPNAEISLENIKKVVEKL